MGTIVGGDGRKQNELLLWDGIPRDGDVGFGIGAAAGELVHAWVFVGGGVASGNRVESLGGEVVVGEIHVDGAAEVAAPLLVAGLGPLVLQRAARLEERLAVQDAVGVHEAVGIRQ